MTRVCLGVFGVLVLVGPAMLLITAVLALGSHGPAGWLLAVLLVLAVVAVTVLCGRTLWRWWRRLGPTSA